MLSACATAARGLRAAVQVVVFMNEASQVAVRVDLRALLARMGESGAGSEFFRFAKRVFVVVGQGVVSSGPSPSVAPTTASNDVRSRAWSAEWQHSGKLKSAVARGASSHDARRRRCVDATTAAVA